MEACYLRREPTWGRVNKFIRAISSVRVWQPSANKVSAVQVNRGRYDTSNDAGGKTDRQPLQYFIWILALMQRREWLVRNFTFNASFLEIICDQNNNNYNFKL